MIDLPELSIKGRAVNQGRLPTWHERIVDAIDTRVGIGGDAVQESPFDYQIVVVMQLTAIFLLIGVWQGTMRCVNQFGFPDSVTGADEGCGT